MAEPQRAQDEQEARRGPTAAIAVGVVAGALSGLFGVGGGILIVPGLVFVMRLPARQAYATSLAAVLPISAASLVGYGTAGKVDWIFVVFLSTGSVVGAVLGTKLLKVVSQRYLAGGFILLLLLTAGLLFADLAEADGRGDLTALAAAGLVAIGMATGVLAGLLGLGGGVMMIPAMVVLFGVPPAVAKGTSLAVIIPTSLAGTLRNTATGLADLRAAALVGVSGIASALVMSKLSVGLDPRTSNVLFAILLGSLATKMLVDLVREVRAGRPQPPADPLTALGE